MKNRRLISALIAASMLLMLTVQSAVAEVACDEPATSVVECDEPIDLELPVESGETGGGVSANVKFMIEGSVVEVVSSEAPLSIRVEIRNSTDSTVSLAAGAITIQKGGLTGSLDPATSGPIEIPANSSQEVVFSGLAAGAGPMGWAEATVTTTVADDAVEPADADSLPDEVEDVDLESIFIAGSGAGAVGSVGPQGPAGDVGPTGPAGPSGSQLIVGAPQTTPANPQIGTAMSASAQCPAGKSALGGGASVTSAAGDEKVKLVASYPDSSSSWSAKGTVDKPLGKSGAMTVEAYVLCSL